MSESLKRKLKATGTILWVTIGATALAGAHTFIGVVFRMNMQVSFLSPPFGPAAF